MKIAALPENEEQRVQALLRYHILDTEAEQVFDDLTELASYICKTPIALISLVDPQRQWFKSKVGLDADETSRDLAFCAHAIHQTEVFIVRDALADARFTDNPLVTKNPKIRFYAGSPLITPDGYALGTLCAIDFKPRKLNTIQLNALQALGRQVISQMELRINIEKLNRTNEKLKTSQILLEKTSRYKTQFLSNMSHEIRTPLNAIVGFSQILLRRSKNLDLPEGFIRHLNNIELSGHNLTKIINDVLDLSRIEAGKMKVSNTNINLRQLIEEIYQINTTKAAEKNIHFTYKIDSHLPGKIFSDYTKLNQILINLVGNAIKFTPANKQIVLKVKLDQNQLLIQVIDEGIGIPQNRKEAIFQTFEQSDDSISQQYGGTGLGLAITKQLVELLQGRIEVSSILGTGSIFSVYLPLIRSIIPENNSKPQTVNFAYAKNKCILVVEDNLMNQEVIKALFEDLELPMYLADNGHTAVEKAKELKPDLILMDIHLPGITGIEATKQILKHPECANIPIVALSADAFQEQQAKGYRTGFVAYLTKPFDMDKMIYIMHKYLNP